MRWLFRPFGNNLLVHDPAPVSAPNPSRCQGENVTYWVTPSTNCGW